MEETQKNFCTGFHRSTPKSFLVSVACCDRRVKPNNKLVWHETIHVINDLFDNVWGNRDEIAVDHIREVFMPVRYSLRNPHVLSRTPN